MEKFISSQALTLVPPPSVSPPSLGAAEAPRETDADEARGAGREVAAGADGKTIPTRTAEPTGKTRRRQTRHERVCLLNEWLKRIVLFDERS